MSTDDQAIEQEIQSKASIAPRVTPEEVEREISSVWYLNVGESIKPDEFQPPVPAQHPLRLLTICVLVLRNGFTVTGQSACASPENFDADIGKKVALADAKQKVWPLLGFLLREELHRSRGN